VSDREIVFVVDSVWLVLAIFLIWGGMVLFSVQFHIFLVHITQIIPLSNGTRGVL
jgi:hypothetical protein